MSSPLAVPLMLVRDAIAKVGSDGVLQPVTESMRDWVSAVAGHWRDLPLDEDQRDALMTGQKTLLSAADSLWEMERAEHDGSAWLIAREVQTCAGCATERLATSRCRWLGSMAGNLAHDLNNQFNAVLALSSHLRDYIQKESDREVIAELEVSTRTGARMAGVVARLLTRQSEPRGRSQPEDVFEDALAMVRKEVLLAGIGLQVDVVSDLPAVRTAHVEAVQAVMHGLLALQYASPRTIQCGMVVEPRAVAGGRRRDCVVLRCSATATDLAMVDQVLAVVRGDAGALACVVSKPDVLYGLANAAFVQRRYGGELLADRQGEGLCIEFVWPALLAERVSSSAVSDAVV